MAPRTREAARGHTPVLLLLVLVSVLAGLAVGRLTAPDEGFQRPPADGAESPPRDEVNGVSEVYAASKSGAVTAATDFMRLMAAVPHDEESYLSTVEGIAAEDWRSEALRLARNGLAFLQERYGEGGSFIFSPLRYRVESYNEREATVSVWGVTVATGTRIRGTEESWLTGTLTLIRENEDWKLAGQTSETGPTPELLETGANPTAAGLGGFEEYANGPRP